MGAVFCFQRLDATNDADAIKEYGEIYDQSCYDHGRGGYSGTFAEAPDCEVIKKKFATFEEAEEYLDEHAEKWGAALIAKTDEGYCVGANCSS